MNNNSPQQNQHPSGEILLYTSPNGKIRLELNMEGDTIWMTQQMMSELFQTSVQNIIMHVQNIYQDVELERDGTCKDFLQVRLEGTRQIKRSITFYNLDMVISVGYRVNSVRGTQFRIWATAPARKSKRTIIPENNTWLFRNNAERILNNKVKVITFKS